MSDGNWRVGVIIDEAASDEQAEKLGAVFSGAFGGPMEALGPLIGENLGVERLPIQVQEDGLKHSIRIGDAVDFEIEDVVPFGVETGEPAKLTGIFSSPAWSSPSHVPRGRRSTPSASSTRRGGLLHVAVFLGGVRGGSSFLLSARSMGANALLALGPQESTTDRTPSRGPADRPRPR